MEVPNYTYPSDSKRDDPNWKDVTNECQELIDEILAEAEKLFGPRANKMPVRVTEFSRGPHICINNGIAYIRLGPGVGPKGDHRQLRSQLALELGHFVLSGSDTAEPTSLEEGLTAYLAETVGGWPPQDDPYQKNYKRAYQLVKALFSEKPGVIRELRQRSQSVRGISIDQIRKSCTGFAEDDVNFLASKWSTH